MPKLDEKIIIRQMQITDLKAVMQIKNAENWNQIEEDWIFLIKSNPQLCLVATYKNLIIGTVTAINYEDKVAWIGMMLVSKAFRGIGVSKALLNTIINKLEGCTSIKLDATPAGIPVYKKLGFIEEYEIGRMVLTGLKNLNLEYRNESISGLTQILKSDISNIVDADKTSFGVNRLKLFQFLLKNKKDICFQINQGNKLKGYAFGRNGSNYIQVGPVIADTTQIAKKLICNVFSKLNKKHLVVDILLDKHELKDWLLSIGFTYQRSFTRMYLKSNAYSGKIENQFLISGPELG